MSTENPKPIRKFFSKMRQHINQDVFMGRLLKLIVRFSIVATNDFQDLMNYVKPDIIVNSRTTIMRRLEEFYTQMNDELKQELNSFNSKFSITCDVCGLQKINYLFLDLQYILLMMNECTG